jgi:glycosyltransferase involved in cell wall biosynthesis
MSKKVCLVTPDISGFVFNGGVGTATVALARLLVEQGHKVDILFSNRQTAHDQAFVWWQARFLEEGITLLTVENPDFYISHGHEFVRFSYAIYEQLRDSTYDRIIFTEMSGCGYFCLRSKEAGLDFQKTDLWVIFHGPSLWHLRFNGALPTQFQQLTTHYMESESVFLADKVLFATEHSRDQAFRLWNKAPRDFEIIMFPFESASPIRRYSNCEEIIFFGRIETRKGIEDFLKALVLIKDFLKKNRLRPVLLGHLGLIQGEAARSKIDKWQKENGIFLEILDDKNHEDAWREIEKRKALLVLASHEETMGYTFVECLQRNVPFIFSNTPAFQELSRIVTIDGRPAFKIRDPQSLANAIVRGLKESSRIKMKSGFLPKLHQDWAKLMEKTSKPAEKPAAIKLSFSICIPHFERFDLLLQALESILEEQMFVKEIIVYDDASKRAHSALKRLEKNWTGIPLKIIFGKKNKGASHARNMMAEVAQGTHLIFLDDDNQLNPDALRDYKKAIQYTKADIVVSSLERVQIAGNKTTPTSIWPPVGPDLSINIFHNVIGDANCCVRRETYLSIGGFNEELRGREDQEFFLRAHLKKAKFAIIPRPLIFYGLHDSNAHLKVNDEANRRMFFQSVEKYLAPGITPLWELTQAWIYSQPAASVWEWSHGPISASRSNWETWPKLKSSSSLLFRKLFTNEVISFDKGLWLDLGSPVKQKQSLLKSDSKVKLIIWLSEATKFSTGLTEILLPYGRSEIVIGFKKDQKLKLSSISGAQKMLISDIRIMPV